MARAAGCRSASTTVTGYLLKDEPPGPRIRGYTIGQTLDWCWARGRVTSASHDRFARINNRALVYDGNVQWDLGRASFRGRPNQAWKSSQQEHFHVGLDFQHFGAHFYPSIQLRGWVNGGLGVSKNADDGF